MRKDNKSNCDSSTKTEKGAKFNNSTNKSRKGSNNRRGRNQSRKGELDDSKFSPSKDDINDSSYYYSDPILRDQICNFSFNQFLGVPFQIAKNAGASYGPKCKIPTFMRVYLSPNGGAAMIRNSGTFDEVKKVTDGVYRASLKNYYTLSAGNAKTTNYQPQDLTMLIFAMTSVMEMVSWMQRILGTVYLYNVRNRDLPEQLVEFQNINYKDLVKNMADYRIRFNTTLQQINKIPVPSNVKAFMKSSALYSNYYTDDTSPMAQMYVLLPWSVWQFDETEAKLTSFRPNASRVTFETLLNELDIMINRILGSATFNYIFADILRLAEKGNMKLLMYGLIPDGYVAPILYSEEFNLWIDNATCAGSPLVAATDGTTPSNDVLQDISHNTLYYAPAFETVNPLDNESYVINFNNNNPDPEAKVAATRLLSGKYRIDSDHEKMIAGSHYVVLIQINDENADGSENIVAIGRPFATYDSTTTAAGFLDYLKRFDLLSKFKHAPHIHVLNKDATADQFVIDSGNYDYFTTLDVNYLARMFDAEWLTYLTIE